MQELVKRERAHYHSLFSTEATNSGSNLDVKHYRCEWKIDPRKRYISGKVRIDFQVTSDTASYLVLDMVSALTLDSVRFRNTRILHGQLNTKQRWVKLPIILNMSQSDSISIYYKGVPDNSGFGAFNKQSHAGVPVIWTMSCPYAARDWWPCKQDLMDKADSIDLIITTPQQYRAAGNGLLVSELQVDTNKIFHWKHKYPIATYLIATAVTNYSSFTHKVHLPSQAIGDSMPVVNFVYPESLNSAKTQTLNVLKILQFYDSLVAPYPFRKEKYGHAQFGWGGGMEHQTMSFMTDFSFNLQAHELAHQWFGNHITCGTWKDVWLNEGWATYMAGLSDQHFGQNNFLNWLNSTQSSVKSSGSGSVYVSDTTTVNRIFDSRLTYSKGAMVLHMLRWQVGDSAFWAGVRNYQADNALAYRFAKTVDFQAHIEASSGKNLQGFFNDWIYGQGYPTYQVKLTQISGNQFVVKLNQTTSHASVPFFEGKVPVRFKAGANEKLEVFDLQVDGQEFPVELPFLPTQIVFDPEKWLVAKSTTQIVTDLLQEVNKKKEISLFPNPIQNQISIINPEGKTYQVQLFTILGEELRSETSWGASSKILDVSDLPSGVIVCRISTGNQIYTYKVVKN